MTMPLITLDLDEAAAVALAAVIRRVRPDDYAVDVAAWYRALDTLSAQLPSSPGSMV